jgi:hypothetical protein
MSERGERNLGFPIVIVGAVAVFFVLLTLADRRQPEEVATPAQRAAVCTAEREETAQIVVTRIGEREIFVDVVIWTALRHDGRVGIASWASECTQDGFRVTIRDAHSGRELAYYSNLRGYGDRR